MKVDYLIVGSGLTGAVIARTLADAGREVLIVERRPHLGGNVHDHTHPSGIRVHTYGPHYFRTSAPRIWEFVNRFATFHPYEARVLARVETGLEQWPVAASCIRRLVGENWKPEFSGTPSNFEEAALALMPRAIYAQFVKEYNEKQWGVPAHTLSASLCTRFDIHQDDDPRLTPKAKFQGIPVEGYAALMQSLIAGIPIELNYDFLQRRDEIAASRRLIFTGPIDGYFGHDLGRLDYRGQQRTHTYLPDAGFSQPCGQVNNPLHTGGPHIRTLEWKHMMPAEFASRIRGTVLTTETPFTPTNPTDYEYPFPDDRNARLYETYRRRAEAEPGLLVCGRLGDYRYYDMDQAIARAMTLAGKLLDPA